MVVSMNHLVPLLALLAATPALAADPVYRAPEGGFVMPLSSPEAEAVCVVRPAALRDAAACEGIDVAALDAQLPAQTVAISILRFEDYATFLQVVRASETARPFDESSMGDFLRGVKQAAEKRFPGMTLRGLTPGAAFDPVSTRAGRTVYGFVQELPAGTNGGNDRILGYVAQSGHQLYSVLVETPAASLDTVAPLAQRLVSRMELAPAPNPSYDMGAALGRLVGMAIALGVTFTLVSRWRRKRAARAGAIPPSAV
jgi:hypothetical protein